MTNTNFDFNDAGEQRTVIPAGTVCTLQLTIRPGGVGDGGWLKRSADGASEGLDAEFTVVDGTYAKRKIWHLFTLSGTKSGHAEAGDISRRTIKAILESARGIRPDDKSDAAKEARKTPGGWADLDQLRFVARLGVRPAIAQYQAKNTLLEVMTPDRHEWKQLEQIDRSTLATKQPANNGGAAAGSTPATPASTPPTNAIARPQWAE